MRDPIGIDMKLGERDTPFASGDLSDPECITANEHNQDLDAGPLQRVIVRSATSKLHRNDTPIGVTITK
jgi:hypothetical protein